eukprot:EG_transcript_10842
MPSPPHFPHGIWTPVRWLTVLLLLANPTTPLPLPTPGCTDLPGWADSENASCAEYAANFFCNPDGSKGLGWVPSWGSFANYADKTGIDASKACCACGKSRCTDVAGWKDSDSETCATYKAMDYCTIAGGYGNGWASAWGTFADYTDTNGLDATKACCACGRGGTPPVADVCGLDYLYEFSHQQHCQVSTGCERSTSLCSGPTHNLSLFQLDACTSPSAAGYLVAVAYAPRSHVTNQTCLVLDGGSEVLVLTVPHRAGQSGNCSVYCDKWCRACRHVDLTAAGLTPNTTVAIPGAPNLTVTYTWDLNCNSTDRYAIAGADLQSIGLPSFTANATCAPGTQENAYTSPSPHRANRCVSPSPRGGRYCSPSPSPSPSAGQDDIITNQALLSSSFVDHLTPAGDIPHRASP